MSRSISVLGRVFAEAVNRFDIKSLQKHLSEVGRKRNHQKAEEAKAVQGSSAKESREDSEEDESVEEEGNGGDEGESKQGRTEDEEQETEPNIIRICSNANFDTSLVCKLLANYESERFVIRLRRIRRVPKEGG